MTRYIHQHGDWPDFWWDKDSISHELAAVRHRQGCLLGRMESLGFDFRSEAVLQTLTEDVIKSSEIEGGLYTPALKTRMQQLEDRAARLRASLQIAGAHQRAVLTAPRRFTTQARKLIGALRERDDTETVLKMRRMIGPVAMTPAAGQSGLRFTLRARRVCEG